MVILFRNFNFSNYFLNLEQKKKEKRQKKEKSQQKNSQKKQTSKVLNERT